MSELSESARRWSGYVCPDCRFVFRVPRDHDGQGVVCPSCRRMLRVPKAEDVSPPLIAGSSGGAEAVDEVVERAEAGVDAEGSEEGVQGGGGGGHGEGHGEEGGGVRTRRRRRSKSKSSDDGISWEHGSGRSRVKRGERGERGERRMRWMMVVGGVLFVGITGLVVKVLSAGKDAVVLPTPVVEKPEENEVMVKDEPRGDGVLLLEIEPLCRRFLNAVKVDELVTMVHDPERVGPLMRKYYGDGVIEAPGMSSLNLSTGLQHGDGFVWINVALGDFENRAIAFVDGPGGLKVDWESFVGWSEMGWGEFRTSMPSEGKEFRVLIQPVDYYNFEFADEEKWRSFLLRSPDGEHTLYGYAERGSLVEEKLLAGEVGVEWSTILELRFPAVAPKSDQVIIDQMLLDGWVRIRPEGE